MCTSSSVQFSTSSSVQFTAATSRRISKTRNGCPECGKQARTRKKSKHPTFAECPDPHCKALLAQWDHECTAPQGNFPDKITLRSNKQIFWLCAKCPAGQQHSWPAAPSQQTGCNESGCPVCAGHAACKCNSLEALYPGIAAEWDHAKSEGQPIDYTASSNCMAWWISHQRGSWQQQIFSRIDQRLKRNQQIHSSAI